MSAVAPAVTHVVCGSCGAALDIDPGLRTALCPYCASPSVLERPPSPDRPAPAFAVGFVVTYDAARDAARRWTRSRGLFTHSGLRRARIDDVRGIYLPAYLYTAIARSQYRARIGENYTETETYWTTDSKGKSVMRTRTVVKTEWRELEGSHATYVRDIVVTASRGVPNVDLGAIEPFDLRALRRYSPALVSGWIAEEPSMSLAQCAELARQETLAAVGNTLNAFMPGDSHGDLTYSTTLENEHVDLVLAPIWVLAVRYDEKKPPVRLLVNGQTSRAYGRAPLSWVKIAIAVALGIGVLILVVLALLAASAASGGGP